MSHLRPYQQQGLAAYRDALGPDVNRVAIEMATGLGKTVTGAQAAVDFLDSHEGAGARVLVIAHTDEIIGQWVGKLRFAVSRGDLPYTVGVVQGDRADEVGADIVVASVWTLAVPGRKERIRDVGFVIVDECHHAVAPSYLTALTHFRAVPTMDNFGRPGPAPIPVLGLSATLRRSDGVGLGKVWQDMPFSRSLSWAIRHGYLIDLVPYTIKIPDLDTSGSDAALDASLADSIAPEAVVQAWLDKCSMPALSRDGWDAVMPSTVVFAPLVKSAEAFADAFSAAGVKAEVVHGKMADAEVAAVMARYEAGVTTVLCNAMKLTEGWDSPRTMCVIVARPTRSVPLFVQMVGRGLRPWLGPDAPPREDQRCVLLCLQGTTTELVTVADLSESAGDVRDGESFLAMEERWDLGKDIPADDTTWRGPVRVEAWDSIVQASSKAWNYTTGGTPYLPTAKGRAGYVFVVPDGGQWAVWHRGAQAGYMPALVQRIAVAPDLELAMAVAEDEAQERGGDVGALVADKSRAWRRGMPSTKLQDHARRLGLERELAQVMAQRSGGKAGKLSDLVSKVEASQVLDPVVVKIKERGGKS